MPRIPLPGLFQVALVLCLWTANAPAQETEMPPPPLPDLSIGPPPDTYSLPAPPAIQWESLPPLSSGVQPGAPPLPPALFVPPAEPAPIEPPLVAHGTAIFASEEPDPMQFQLAKPRIEIWRANALAPEAPSPISDGLGSTLIVSGDPIWVRLLFDPSLTGTAVQITATEDVTIMQPILNVINIGPTGECLLLVDVKEEAKDGQISFFSQQITTDLRLEPVSAEIFQSATALP